ncbi:MAG TPA: YfhO family protein [Patescibacteria group bacterium]|nr:YfhO family protein [Patescibacteria group bacterium]
MLSFLKKNCLILFLVLISVVFFYKTIAVGLLPLPSDTIVGLYYPFRDNYAKTNPRGVPFKNFLITDPVRQTYPWKNLSIEIEKKIQLPLWNPYNFSGTPLLANFQSGVFYPLNILYFILPFEFGWSIMIILSPILAGVFMYLFLRNLDIRKEASLLGAIALSFSGFFIAWMEWGNIIHTALWLPLILLSIDKIYTEKEQKGWGLLLLFSLIASFFAGHLQTFFYILVLAFLYSVFRWFSYGRKLLVPIRLILIFIIFTVLAAIQWVPTLQFILLSARNADLIGINNPGWFVPLQNIVQFLVPDFFGNPTTLNYWGIWNYAEFVGYIGVIPLMMAFIAILFRRDKNTIFFSLVLLFSLILAFATPFAKLPFILHIPFVNTSQPTRLLFIVCFSLSVLCGLGADYFMKEKKKNILVIAIFAVFFVSIWVFIVGKGFNLVEASNLIVAKKNLILPTLIFLLASVLFIFNYFISKKKYGNFSNLVIYLLILISVFDLFRFGWKFESFTKSEYLFPSTKVLSFIQKDPDIFRVMSDNSEIFPPNFSIMYKIQTPDGYDPLYIKRYGELVAAYGRKKPDISAPFGFNRIITLQDYKTNLVDLLGVKYVLSKNQLLDPKLTNVYTDGTINVYKNSNALPRAFFVSTIVSASNDQNEIEKLIDTKDLLSNTAFVETNDNLANKKINKGNAKIVTYSPNRVIINTDNSGDGFLVLTDAYYPTWKVKIDGVDKKIYITDYAFRGVFIPKGKHTVEFYNNLL